jgi:hypothetical protein
LDAGRDPERPELLQVSLAYRIRATLQTDSIGFSLNMSGEAA